MLFFKYGNDAATKTTTNGDPTMRGNLSNRVMEQHRQPAPEIGMGATSLHYSDRHAFTIIAVGWDLQGKTVAFTAQRDEAIRTDKNGMSDSQSYRYERRPESTETYIVTLRPNGRWITMGEAAKHGTTWAINQRDEHYDYSH